MEKSMKISAGGIGISRSVDYTPSEQLNTRHIHDMYEILYVSEGAGRYLIEGAEFELKPRTLLLIKPFKYHCVDIAPCEAYERCVVHFPASAVLKDALPMLEKLADSSDTDSGTFFAPGSLPQSALSVFDRMELASSLPEAERCVYLKMLLSELILLLSVAASSKISHDGEALGAKVIKYINDHLDKDVSLDTIARRFFVSKYYLCRSFKKYSGVSVHAYISHKRVMYAKQLIDSGETAALAAYKVGFGDYSAFYRTHVKLLGVPPTLQSKRREP